MAPRTPRSPSSNSQETAKSAIPHLAGHTLQPMPHRSPYTSDPHTGHVPIRTHGSPIPATKLQKSRHWFRRDQRPAPQIPNRSCPTDSLNLRHISANQSPTDSSKSHMPATGGGGAVTSCTYGHGHIHSRVCARPWSRAHIHGHAHGHGASQPDETSVRFTQIKRQSNSLKRPAAA